MDKNNNKKSLTTTCILMTHDKLENLKKHTGFSKGQLIDIMTKKAKKEWF